MKGWDEKLGVLGRCVACILAVIFLLFGGIGLFDAIQTGTFNIQTSDKVIISFLFWGIAMVVVTIRGRLFK